MTEETCHDYLGYDEALFVCLLPTGHTGRHRDDLTGDDTSTRRGMTVEWDQEPTTVSGEVLP